MPADQTRLNLDQVRADLDQWQARTALPLDAADRAVHTLASHVPALLAALSAAEADRDDARVVRDATRRLAIEGNTLLRQQLLAALGRDDDGHTSLSGYITALTDERDQARAELAGLRQQLDRIVTNSGSHYEQLIVAIRGALSGPGGSADYWRWNGQVQVVRETANEIARVAAIPTPDWEQIKASVPADGVYRAAPVPAMPAPEALHDRLTAVIETALTPSPDVSGCPGVVARIAAHAALTVIAQGAATPAVGEQPQGGAEPADVWSHIDDDGDGIDIDPRLDSAAGWIITTSADGAYLTPAAAASLHTWLGRMLGTPAPSTPARPAPGPQDIPDAWLAALLAEEMHPAGRVRAGYRLGYAAHAGCEIEILDGQVHIGDLAIPAAPASEGDAR